jgi:predicted Zn finger-like uncharacterized protein
MTLDCPRCGTSYRVPESRTGRSDVPYECAKCHAVFRREAPPPDTDHDDEWRDEPEADEAFRFDDERGPTMEAADDAGGDPDADEDENDAPPRARPKATRRRGRVADDEESPPGVARFALRSLIAVTLGYAVASIWASTHPEVFQQTLARLPVLGALLAEMPLDPGDVTLQDVRGEFAYLKSGELAFVVRGKAVNHSATALRRIQVEGRIDGTEMRRARASCSDAPADLQKTSRQMLMLMDDVRETRPGSVDPGEGIACEVVFVDPPRPLRELSLEVVSVLAN